MIADQDLRIPAHSHEDGFDSAADGSHEDLTDLQADDEGEGHDNSREVSIGVVARLSELQIQIRQQGADVRHKDRAHGDHRPDETVVDKCVDAAVSHHGPRILGRRDICLPVQGDMTESVAVEQCDKPVEDGDETSENPKHDAPHNTPLCSLVALRDRARLPQHIDNRDDQTSETDAAERVCGCAPECAPCCSLWHAVR